jgi:hypothetical protein
MLEAAAAMNMSTWGSEVLARDIKRYRKTTEPISVPRHPMSRKCFTCVLKRKLESGNNASVLTN